MYAVIRAGGKQHKVAPGDVIEVERLKEASDEVSFVPLLVVDDDGNTRSGRSELASARVTAKVIGDAKGPKVDVHKYRSKTGYRRHTGHRQRYTTLQITDISLTGSAARKSEAAGTGTKE